MLSTLATSGPALRSLKLQWRVPWHSIERSVSGQSKITRDFEGGACHIAAAKPQKKQATDSTKIGAFGN